MYSEDVIENITTRAYTQIFLFKLLPTWIKE